MKKIDSQPSNKFSLTSLYFSARYRVLKNLSFSASYDNRRNVIYYESYQTFIDQLLAQETRQGFRLQANYSPVRNISVNASAFVRYQGDNPKPTTNYVGNLSFNKIPLHNVSLSLSGNILESVYFKGTIIGGRISDNFMKGKLNLELNYRNVNYSFFNTESNLKQHIAGANLSFNIFRKTSLMLSYEGTFDKTNSDYHRYYVTINQRFKINYIMMKKTLLLAFTILIISCDSKPKVLVADENTNPAIVTNNQGPGTMQADNLSTEVHQVVANEILNTDRYTYLYVTEGNRKFWLATSKMDAQKGRSYMYSGGLMKVNFESIEFKRNFDTIYLVSQVLDASLHSAGNATPSGY
ncbi:MAG: hypothetical protein IPH57_06810 [Saprospiraceae bacterium]|nr:hypothetical protein [Saprospiraceae bacterium]